MNIIKSYLKFIKENISYKEKEELFKNCKDILLELEDKGFMCRIEYFYTDWMTFYIKKRSTTNNKLFNYSDIEDVVERLKEYLLDFGFYLDWMSDVKLEMEIDPVSFQPTGYYRTDALLHFSERKKSSNLLSESVKEEKINFWKLDEDEIREYLIELTDANYILQVTFGFLGIERNYVWSKSDYDEKEVFTEKVLSGSKVRPAYWIQISSTRHSSREDLTDTLKFAVDIISDKANAECRLQDSGGDLDINAIQIKGGLFVDGDLEAEDYIAIFAIQEESVDISEKDLVEFYGWDVSLEKDGRIWTEMDIEDLADYLLTSKASYKEYLIKGTEAMWDNYDISYYYDDIPTLFQYTLSDENKNLVVKSIIKDLGGLEQTINHIGDECDDSIYEKVKEMNEEELINYLVKERYNDTIKQISFDSESFLEVRDTVANWNMSAHCDDNYGEIVNEFESIVEDEIGTFSKVEKEVTKHWTNSEGERKEYKTEVTYYQFPFDNKWMESADPEELFGKNLDDVFRDWIREGDFRYDLEPRFSDYGDVDSKKMNEEIKAYLTRYLSK